MPDNATRAARQTLRDKDASKEDKRMAETFLDDCYKGVYSRGNPKYGFFGDYHERCRKGTVYSGYLKDLGKTSGNKHIQYQASEMERESCVIS